VAPQGRARTKLNDRGAPDKPHPPATEVKRAREAPGTDRAQAAARAQQAIAVRSPARAQQAIAVRAAARAQQAIAMRSPARAQQAIATHSAAQQAMATRPSADSGPAHNLRSIAAHTPNEAAAPLTV
jgi:hypothetical protein